MADGGGAEGTDGGLENVTREQVVLGRCLDVND